MSKFIKKNENTFKKQVHGGCKNTSCLYYDRRFCPGEYYICFERK